MVTYFRRSVRQSLTAAAVAMVLGNSAVMAGGKSGKYCPPSLGVPYRVYEGEVISPAPSTAVPAPGAEAAAPGVEPMAPGAEAAPAPAASTPFDFSGSFASGLDVADSGQSLAPNMVGDFFSGRSSRIQTFSVVPGIFNGRGTGTFNGAMATGANPDGTLNFTAPGLVVIQTPAPNLPPIPVQTDPLNIRSASPFTAGVNNPASIPLNLSSGNFAAIQNGVQTQGGALVLAGEQANQDRPGGMGGQALPPVITFNGGNAVAAGGIGGPPNANPNVPSGLYSLVFDATIESFVRLSQNMFIDVPSPSGGGTVGRLKIAENSSPLPRDRVYFTYNYFNSVPISNTGIDVSTMTPGIEKTFFDGRTSVEVRMPFASTLDSNQSTTGFSGNNLEFGNMTFIPKVLLSQSSTLATSAGLGITIPTADDIVVNGALGTPLVRVQNESVHLSPFVGALLTPNDRLFMQGFLQFDFDANGNPVQTDIFGTGLTNSGRLQDQNSMFVDAAIGYWLTRGGDGFVTGIAPIAEIHYNAAITDSDVIRANGLVPTGFANRYDIVNYTSAINFEFMNNTTLTTALVVPLTGNNDRQFDYEIAVQLNHRFGPRTRASRVQF